MKHECHKIDYTYIDKSDGYEKIIYVYRNCIGAKCAAYKTFDFDKALWPDKPGNLQWCCCAFPQEVWHDVEAKHDA